MKVDIVEEIENELLERKEVIAKIQKPDGSTPTRDEVLARVAAMLNKDRKEVVLIKMQPKFGTTLFTAKIHAYSSVDRAISIEKPHLLRRSKIIEEKQE